MSCHDANKMNTDPKSPSLNPNPKRFPNINTSINSLSMQDNTIISQKDTLQNLQSPPPHTHTQTKEKTSR